MVVIGIFSPKRRWILFDISVFICQECYNLVAYNALFHYRNQGSNLTSPIFVTIELLKKEIYLFVFTPSLKFLDENNSIGASSSHNTWMEAEVGVNAPLCVHVKLSMPFHGIVPPCVTFYSFLALEGLSLCSQN